MDQPTRIPEGVVQVRVAFGILPEFLEHLPLIKAKVIGACTDYPPGHSVVQLLAEDMPEGAVDMVPAFTRSYPDGEVGIASVEWLRADGTRIPTTERFGPVSP